jgi:hypothetical protein
MDRAGYVIQNQIQKGDVLIARTWIALKQRSDGLAAASRSATMEFFENNPNCQGGFYRAAGEGDSSAVPFPRPLLLLRDAKIL